jgi:cytochrome c oxidase cbb3-type subunit III
MLKRIVSGVEILAAIGVLVFVVMLFANEPSNGEGGTGQAQDPGAEIYAQNCARCHGADGGGGVGPQLADGKVVEEYPTEADEIAVVEEGPGSMPAFRDSLSPEEIQQVVQYTRAL